MRKKNTAETGLPSPPLSRRIALSGRGTPHRNAGRTQGRLTSSARTRGGLRLAAFVLDTRFASR
jgi:hypothetical protein